MTASMQTTLAQAAARDAEQAWKEHQGHCPACMRMKRDRSAVPCAHGAEIRNEALTLRQTAKSEAAKDKLPMPGQDALW